jgi:uncharacterized protein (DUF1697 family)
MPSFVALLRAVNVGGTGKLPMADLRALGEQCGFTSVRTYIASGNLLFDHAGSESDVQTALETRLAAYAGKRVPVLIRTEAELQAIIAADPFPDAHGSRHMVFFLNQPPAADLIAECRDANGERLALGPRELFVDYGDGIRFTKLKIPSKEDRTGRNMNSVKAIAALLHQRT